MVVDIFCFYHSFNSRYLFTLGVAYPYLTLSMHFFGKGNGHYVKPTLLYYVADHHLVE